MSEQEIIEWLERGYGRWPDMSERERQELMETMRGIFAEAVPHDSRDVFELRFSLTMRQAKMTKTGGYIDELTQARWEGWQAAKGEGK